jgi:murein DD-endopeptidase MepM/ murein hydrolase activator NlpD
VRFWRDEDGGRRRALVGVDLEEPTRKAPLALSRGGEPACRVELEVKDGGFGETRLRVARGYVDLSPADRKRTRREAARLEKIFATASAERLWREPFRLPLDDADHADNFGQRRIFNDQPRSPHSGLDFPAETGTPVRATQRGRVALASALFYSGRTVILDHGLGLFTFYGHMSALDVAEGLLVDSGTVLGRVGKTGRATGPHLHWSARLNGARINPLELIALFPG